MVTCTFCGNKTREGTGKIFVLKEGKMLHFCSNKCEKNMFKLKRTARNLKWTKAHKKE